MNNPRFQPPQAAYVHVPFCRHRCGYCNFTLIAGRDDLMEGYLDALGQELAALDSPQPMRTLYFGGGTPSHLPLAMLERLFEQVRAWLPLAEDSEFTCEANPVDVTSAFAECLVRNQVSRVSLGVQSFAPRKLRLLERDHDAAIVAAAVAELQQAGLSVSLDLIFATPGETSAEWGTDLEQALALQPEHLSTYGLTWERGTRFWARSRRGELVPLNDAGEAELYEIAIDRLTSAGFEHYEVSNFARAGRRSRHNLTYWQGGTYFAFGPGAARHVEGRRSMNHRSTTTYLRRLRAGQSPIAETECLSDQDAVIERLVFGLRMISGIDTRRLRSETGWDVHQLVGPTLDRLRSAGLLAADGDRLRVTRRGLLLCDTIAAELLTAAALP